MSPLVEDSGVSEFRDFVARRFGLKFGDEKRVFLAETLRRRLDATNSPSVAEYVRHSLLTAEEQAAVAAALTVAETYFFRGSDQLLAFREAVLPDRLEKRRTTRDLRILSAGCATGEEPYTIAMILQDSFPELQAWKIAVSGYDLNSSHLRHAQRARYSTWSLRETSQEARERCFRREESDFIVNEVYRERVAFREVNLSDPPPDALPPEVFDVVFCRNVIMYFTPEAMSSVIQRLARALVPGGYLFLGHAETLRGLSPDFTLRHTHETFYYQRRDGRASVDAPISFWPAADPRPAPVAGPAPLDASWVESIRVSSERVEMLSRGLERGSAATPARSETADSSGSDLGRANELLRQERFAEALPIVCALLEKEPRNQEGHLLHAVLLTACGRPSEAESVCAGILRADDLNAEAHHLIALCREQAKDLDGAIEQDQIAEYLDPGFAMPRIHVGRLARRRGNLSLARRELSQALALLGREEPVRLHLFGGGFGREALVQLCRTELEACGGAE